MQHVTIIGSGIGGLGLACLLGKAGYKVTLIEKNDMLGGRANLFEANGFTFDMGPSWYLMPDIFEQFFKLLEEDIHDHLTLKKLAPSYRIFFKGEKELPVVDIFSDLEKDMITFEQLEPGVAPKIKKYLGRAKYQYDAAKTYFMYKNYDSVFDFLNWRVFKESWKMNLLGTMDKYTRKFFKSSRVRKIMQYTLVFLGSEPKKTPALYNIMNHIDFAMGVYYPEGGIYAIIRALENLAKSYGVEIKTGSPVKRIMTKHGKAHGVELESGEQIESDLVVSNADMAFTETKLLPKELQTYPKSYWDKRVLAPSAFILYLGLKDEVDSLTHHNLLFSKNWEENFAQIFDKPQLPDDPSYYVCCPSKTDKTIVPEGKDALFVLVPIPAGMDLADEQVKRYRDKIIQSMQDDMGIENFEDRIEYERMYLPEDFKRDYNAQGGTALGLAHTLLQTAIFRPNNISKKVKDLYYVGAGTNPGIGMPICLISAEMVYKRIKGIKQAQPLSHL